MRNLKKVLALVLALVMALGLMSVASAKTAFTDDGSINKDYREAVEVLTALKVYQGKNSVDTFAPKDTITRAEVAAILYRLVTNKDAQASIYAGYADFADVKAKGDNYWAAGYIGYCSNAQYIIGDLVNFYPDMQVTGYQALAMILRAMGYDQNKEFQGSGWEIRVASTARERGILANVTEGQLVGPASREMVAELLFRASIQPVVNYTSALGYNKYQDTLVTADSRLNESLAETVFGLYKDEDQDAIDEWGRPGYFWMKGGKWDAEKKLFTADFAKKNIVAAIAKTPVVTYTEAVHECDVAAACEMTAATDFELYVNSGAPVTKAYNIVPTDTITAVGAQGRLTEVYYETAGPVVTLARVVMIDTYLAKVMSVIGPTFDAADHVITPATLVLRVYDHNHTPLTNTTNHEMSDQCFAIENDNTYDSCYELSTVSLENGKTPWEYTRGQYLLLNTYSRSADPTPDDPLDDDDLIVNGQATGDDGQSFGSGRSTANTKNAAAYETDKIPYYADAEDLTAPGYATPWVLKAASSVSGKQTAVYRTANKHNVDSTDTPDANTLYYDEAGDDMKGTYVWYKDAYGNIIGVDNSPNSIYYGAITKMWWSNDSSTGSGKALADITLTDGTTKTGVEISTFLMNTANGTTAGPADGDDNVMTEGLAGNVTEIRPVPGDTGIDDGNGQPLSLFIPNAAGKTANDGTIYDYDSKIAQFADVLPVSIYASSNGAVAETFGIITDNTNDAASKKHGNLFCFFEGADNAATAVEVAGIWDGTAKTNGAAAPNDGRYANFRNALSAAAADDAVVKGQKYVTLAGGDASSFMVSSDTRYLVYNTTTEAFTSYTGADMPAKILIERDSEVDWVVDDNGIATHVFLTGTASGTVKYGLFYFLGETRKTSTEQFVSGWLDGERVELRVPVVGKDTAAENSLYDALMKVNDLDQSAAAATEKEHLYKGHLIPLMVDGDTIATAYSNANNSVDKILEVIPETNGAALDDQIVGYVKPDGTAAAKAANDFKFGLEGDNTYSKTAPKTNVVVLDGAATQTNDGNQIAKLTATSVGWELSLDKTDDDGSVHDTDAANTFVIPFREATVGVLNVRTLPVSYITMVYQTVGGQNIVSQVYVTQYENTKGEEIAPASTANTISYQIATRSGVTSAGIVPDETYSSYATADFTAANAGKLKVIELTIDLAETDQYARIYVVDKDGAAYTNFSNLFATAAAAIGATTTDTGKKIDIPKGQSGYFASDDGAQHVVVHVTVN